MAWHVVVLAAGRGRRMGGPKALMTVAGRAWWQSQEERLERTGLGRTWVVSPEVAQQVQGLATVIGDPDAPMFDSIRRGIAAAAPGSGVFVMPVDVPAPAPAIFASLSAAAMSGASIPTYAGKRGHPVALSRAWIDRVLPSAGTDPRLDRLIDPDVTEVNVEDPDVIANLNSPDEVRRWLGT